MGQNLEAIGSKYKLGVQLDSGIMDCGYNYRYSRKVVFPITILSDVTNESNSLLQGEFQINSY